MRCGDELFEEMYAWWIQFARTNKALEDQIYRGKHVFRSAWYHGKHSSTDYLPRDCWHWFQRNGDLIPFFNNISKRHMRVRQWIAKLEVNLGLLQINLDMPPKPFICGRINRPWGEWGNTSKISFHCGLLCLCLSRKHVVMCKMSKMQMQGKGLHNTTAVQKEVCVDRVVSE